MVSARMGSLPFSSSRAKVGRLAGERLSSDASDAQAEWTSGTHERRKELVVFLGMHRSRSLRRVAMFLVIALAIVWRPTSAPMRAASLLARFVDPAGYALLTYLSRHPCHVNA